MNVAFFGTSNKSAPILEALRNSQYNLKLCVTKEDVKVGRKQELKQTAVKSWAIKNRVQFITTYKLDAESKEIIATELKDNNIDLIVVADFAFIIPEEIYNLPKYKTINIHFSMLPHYRGSSPVQFSILNGDKRTGISYILMGKKLDAGPIIYQSEHNVSEDDTTESLYNRLFKKAAEEIEEVIKNYVDGTYKPEKQNEAEATYTYSPTHPDSTLIFKKDAMIDWNKSDTEIYNMIRAFHPWPVAWTTLDEINKNILPIKQGKDLNKRVKIYSASFKNNKLSIDSIQVEGKQKVSWNEFKNGYGT